VPAGIASFSYSRAARVMAVVLAMGDSFAFIAMNTQSRPAQRYRAEDRKARRGRRPLNTSGSSTNEAETMESGAERERNPRVVMTLSRSVR